MYGPRIIGTWLNGIWLRTLENNNLIIYIIMKGSKGNEKYINFMCTSYFSHNLLKAFCYWWCWLFLLLIVDDGSGTIACCRWHQSDRSVDNGKELYNLGQLVTVQGKISVFREQRQLTVDLICIHTSMSWNLFYEWSSC